jgi:penicillin V acylase-like amidase (Ntn superfamily)
MKMQQIRRILFSAFNIILATTLLFTQSLPVHACSVFSMVTGRKQVMVGKTFDWSLGDHGAVFLYPRDTKRMAFLKNELPPSETLQWKSKFASLTFTQFGKGITLGGVNERGLVVEVVMLDDLFSGKCTHLKKVNETQWVQYQLDHFETTEEVLKNSHGVGIDQVYIGLQYFVTDASGTSATIEFEDGKPYRIHSGKDLPIKALTNLSYPGAIKKFQKLTDPTLLQFSSLARDSQNRFNLLGLLTQDRFISRLGPNEKHYGIKILDYITVTDETRYDRNKSAKEATWEEGINALFGMDLTQWATLYEVSQNRVHFKTKSHSNWKTVDLKKIRFDQLKAIQVLDMNLDKTGDVTSEFKEFRSEFDADLIEKSSEMLDEDLIKRILEHNQRELEF